MINIQKFDIIIYMALMVKVTNLPYNINQNEDHLSAKYRNSWLLILNVLLMSISLKKSNYDIKFLFILLSM